jgi:hypothetical protein
MIEVVHSSPAKMPVADRKTCRLDDVGLDAQARAEPENRSGILWNIRLEESNTHSGTALSTRQNVAKNLCLVWFLRVARKRADSGLALFRQGCQ